MEGEKDETFYRSEGPKDPFGTEKLVTLNLADLQMFSGSVAILKNLTLGKKMLTPLPAVTA